MTDVPLSLKSDSIFCSVAKAILISAFLASPVLGSSLLEEVVVTAQKREQNAQDIPIAISAFTGDQLIALGVTSTMALADNVAGVHMTKQYANAPSFTVRGLNANDYAAATSPAVAVYMDGIYKASNINSGAQLFDIARVEIMKGPQGTLWGKNTTGGAVSINTVRPSQESDGYLTVGFGADSQHLIEGAVGGALSSTLSARLSFQYIESDGPYENVTFPTTGIVPGSIPPPNALNGAPAPEQFTSIWGPDQDPGAQETMAFRGQLLWQPNDDFQALLIGHYATDKSKDPPFVSSIEDPDVEDDEVSLDMVTVNDNEFYGVTADLRWQLGPGELVSITGWDAFDRRGQGGDFSNTAPGALLIPAATPFLAVRYWTEFEQFSQELRYEMELDNLFWLAGMYYSQAEYDQSGDNTMLGVFGSYFENPYLQEDESIAAFAHVEWGLAENWKLNAGLRYSDETRERKSYQVYFETGFADFWQSPTLEFPSTLLLDIHGGGLLGPNPYPNKHSVSDVSYRIGVDWTPSDDVLAYYSLSQGLKSGGFDTSPVTGMANLAPIDDEEVVVHEIGLKWSPSDSLRFNAAAFYSDYTNMQQRVGKSDPLFGNVILLTNLDQVDISGIELELVWAPMDGLELSANASFLESEIDDTTVVSPVTGGSVSGNKVPFAPETAVSLLGRYEFAVSTSLRASIQAAVNYTGNHFISIENLPVNEQDYAIVNARIAVSDAEGDWELSLYGNNLTDEIYRTGSSWAQLDYWISRPRTWLVRLDYRF